METPRERLFKAALEKYKEKAGSPETEAETVDRPAAVAEFPSEPFPCPACGQMLAPSCRVCVACKHTIDPAEISRPHEVAAAPAPSPAPKPEPVPYPWRIFFAVLGISFLFGLIYSATIYRGLLKEDQAELALHGAPILAGVWVFFDALRRRIPRPLRWALGTMLLLIIVFPWYLGRRKKPQSPVPFVEAEVGPVTRFLLFALLILFLASLVFYIVKGPQPASHPPPANKEQKDGTSSPSRIAALLRGQPSGLRAEPCAGPCSGVRTSRPQAGTRAPSDAWQM